MSERTYDYVGIVMAKSEEGDAVATVVGRQEESRCSSSPRSGTSARRTGW